MSATYDLNELMKLFLETLVCRASKSTSIKSCFCRTADTMPLRIPRLWDLACKDFRRVAADGITPRNSIIESNFHDHSTRLAVPRTRTAPVNLRRQRLVADDRRFCVIVGLLLRIPKVTPSQMTALTVVPSPLPNASRVIAVWPKWSLNAV